MKYVPRAVKTPAKAMKENIKHNLVALYRLTTAAYRALIKSKLLAIRIDAMRNGRFPMINMGRKARRKNGANEIGSNMIGKAQYRTEFPERYANRYSVKYAQRVNMNIAKNANHETRE